MSNREKDILASIEMRAAVPLSEIAKECGHRIHTVRYCVKSMIERGVITLQPVVNFQLLGFSQYLLYFSLSFKSSSDRALFLSGVKKVPGLRSISNYVGDFDYEAEILAEDSFDLFSAVQRLMTFAKSAVSNRTICTEMSSNSFNTRCLLHNSHNATGFSTRFVRDTVDLDEIDLRILDAMLAKSIFSRASLARKLGLAASTLDYRLQRLEKQNILLGWKYTIDLEILGFQSYKLLLSANQANQAFNKKLRKFCRQNYSVNQLSQIMGNWDYELIVNVKSREELLTQCDLLQETFGTALSGIRMLTYLSKRLVSFNLLRPRMEERPSGQQIKIAA